MNPCSLAKPILVVAPCRKSESSEDPGIRIDKRSTQVHGLYGALTFTAVILRYSKIAQDFR